MSNEKTPERRISGALSHSQTTRGRESAYVSHHPTGDHSLPTGQGFREWLTNREDDGSIVDSLAYDVRHDGEFPDAGDFWVFESYFEGIGAIPEAHDALRAAWRQYRPDAYSPYDADDDARDLMTLLGFEPYGHGRCGCQEYADLDREDGDSMIMLHDAECPRFVDRTRPAPFELYGSIRDLFGDLYINPKATKETKVTQRIKHSGTYVSRQKLVAVLIGDGATA